MKEKVTDSKIKPHSTLILGVFFRCNYTHETIKKERNFRKKKSKPTTKTTISCYKKEKKRLNELLSSFFFSLEGDIYIYIRERLQKIQRID